MGRLIELIFFAFVFYMVLRWIMRVVVGPIKSGFFQRDEERKRERWSAQKKEPPKIDRSGGVQDAEYRDL
jgi:hypothetical protein